MLHLAFYLYVLVYVNKYCMFNIDAPIGVLDWLINIFIAEQMMDGGWQPF